MTLASGEGESDLPDCSPPASFSVYLAVKSLQRDLSTNPNVGTIEEMCVVHASVTKGT